MRRPAWHASALAAVLALPVAGLVTLGEGNAPTSLDQGTGSVWIASPGQGLVSLIDGSSDAVVASVLVPGAGHELSLDQAGASAYLTDATVGTVARVDGATTDVSAAVRFGGADSGVSVLHGGDQVYVVDPGRSLAYRVDPQTLTTLDEIPLAAAPAAGQAVVDDAGRLWIVDATRGGLTWYDGTKHVDREAASAQDRLVLAEGRPVLVDTDAGELRSVSGDGRLHGRGCLDVPAGAGVQLLGAEDSPEVYAAVSASATLLIARTDSPDCGRVVRIGTPDLSDFGPLTRSGRYVFIPDHATGTTTVVDTARDEVVATLALAEPGHALELVSKDGFVFYNDRDSSVAGVVRFADGEWSTSGPLAKFDPSTGVPAVPPAPPGGPGTPAPPPTPEPTPLPDTPDPTPPPGAAPTPRPDQAAPPRPRPTTGPGDQPPGTAPPTTTPTPTVTPSREPTQTPTPTAEPEPTTPAPTPALTPPGITGLDVEKDHAAESLRVVPRVEGQAATDVTWTWQTSVGGSPHAAPPAPPGTALPLPWQPGARYTVSLTLRRDGQVLASHATTFDLEPACSTLAPADALDLRRATTATVLVSTSPGCSGSQRVTVRPSPWLSVAPAEFDVQAGAQVPVTVTRVGPPPQEGTDPAAVRVLVDDAPAATVPALGNLPPVLVTIDCIRYRETLEPGGPGPVVKPGPVITIYEVSGSFSDANRDTLTVRVGDRPVGAGGSFSVSSPRGGPVRVVATDEWGASTSATSPACHD